MVQSGAAGSRPPRVAPLERADPVADLAGAGPHSFWLESALAGERQGRFGFWGARPLCILAARGRRLTLQKPGAGTVAWEGDPFDALRGLLRQGRRPRAEGELPFSGGAVGYFGYGLRTLLEDVPARARDDLRFPDLWFAFYDRLRATDHRTGRSWQIGAPRLGPRDGAAAGHAPAAPGRSAARVASTFDRASYCRAVERAREYIAAGDIYQVNLSQRFHVPGGAAPGPLALFDRLRAVNPAPFSALLRMGRRAVVSASPERFLKLEGRRVETRPIKGTRPRGRDAARDRRLRRELLASAKDNAELAMIVDLERNDLGRVCEFGSVRVAEPRVLETYPTVSHLVATVEGVLRPRLDVVDLVRATFPGGSITGVPKIRAMEIIDELEPTARNVYTGAIGYLGFDGSADLSIGIRLLEVRGADVFFSAGGGIVADSDPESEYEETLAKAEGMFRVLGIARGGRSGAGGGGLSTVE